MLVRDDMLNIIRRGSLQEAPGNPDGTTHRAAWFCHICNITYRKTVALCPRCNNNRDIIREAGKDYRAAARFLVHGYKRNVRHARDDTEQDLQPYTTGASSSNDSQTANAYARALRVADRAVAVARDHAKEACIAADIANDTVYATQRTLVAAQIARNDIATNYSNTVPN